MTKKIRSIGTKQKRIRSIGTTRSSINTNFVEKALNAEKSEKINNKQNSLAIFILKLHIFKNRKKLGD